MKSLQGLILLCCALTVAGVEGAAGSALYGYVPDPLSETSPLGLARGYATLGGEMDIALALRTIVVPTALHRGAQWVYHLQASGGIVFDSDAHAEYEETVNKSAAMVRAIDLAERAFVRAQ